jgi:hypothetical protein
MLGRLDGCILVSEKAAHVPRSVRSDNAPLTLINLIFILYVKKDNITYINNDQPAERQCYAGGFVAPACRKHDSVMVREPVQTGQLRRSMPLQRGGKGARHNLANGRDHNHPAQLPQWILLILMPSEMAPRCLPWLVGLELRLSGPSALEWRGTQQTSVEVSSSFSTMSCHINRISAERLPGAVGVAVGVLQVEGAARAFQTYTGAPNPVRSTSETD